MKFFFFSFLGLGLFSSLEAAAPWQRESVRQSPWGSSAVESGPSFIAPTSSKRAKSRETFFRGLSGEQQSRSEDFQQVPVTELRQLPWAEYEREWNGSFDEDFLWPVAGGKISSGFGIRHGRPHEGLDIKGNRGATIRSTADGRVVFAGWMPGYGRMLVIAHGDGYSSIYAHNQANLVDRGAVVKRGQAIAELGSTGKTSGPHLHFEVRKDGKALNPLRFHYSGRWDNS